MFPKTKHWLYLQCYLTYRIHIWNQLAPTFTALIPARQRSHFALAYAAVRRSIIIKKKEQKNRP